MRMKLIANCFLWQKNNTFSYFFHLQAENSFHFEISVLRFGCFGNLRTFCPFTDQEMLFKSLFVASLVLSVTSAHPTEQGHHHGNGYDHNHEGKVTGPGKDFVIDSVVKKCFEGFCKYI